MLAGRYKLMEEIGQGGMGSVHMARQTEPVKRAVAVKVRNLWNADALFVLTHTAAQARELAVVFEQAGIGAMPQVRDDMEHTDLALGTCREEYGLLTVWWD